jgi:hypothetical protein
MGIPYTRHTGPDVHKITFVAVRLPENDEVQTEVRTLDTTMPELLSLLNLLPECGRPPCRNGNNLSLLASCFLRSVRS